VAHKADELHDVRESQERHGMKPTRARFELPRPGFFTELVRLHNWPPMFEPKGHPDPGALKRSEAATRGREKQAAMRLKAADQDAG
jgi:hypothetical protein